MNAVLNFLSEIYSTQGLVHILSVGGIWILILIVFIETGLLAGFFLPGDSLLITAGILSSSQVFGEKIFNVQTLLPALSIAAILGDQLNYYLGKRLGLYFFQNANGGLIKKKYFVQASDFYDKHGNKAIILARFAPIFRTFVPFTAGMAQMPYKKFVLFDIVGGLSWVFSMVLLGHYLGTTPWAQKIHQVILVVVIVSLLPAMIGILKRILKKN